MAMLPPDPVYILKGEMDPVMCVVYRITLLTEHLYAGTQNGSVHIWNLKTNKEEEKLECRESCISIHIQAEEAEEEDRLIVQTKLGGISFWVRGKTNWSCVNKVDVDFCGFCKLELMEDILIVPWKESSVHYFKITNTNTELQRVYKPTEKVKLGEVMALRLTTICGEAYLWAAYESGHLWLWKVKGESSDKVGEIKMEDCPMAVEFDARSMKGVYGSTSNQVTIFKVDSGLSIHIARHISLTNAGVASIAVRADQRVLALGCWDGKIRLYSWKNLVLLAVLDTHASTVQDVLFSDKPVTAWDCKCLLAAASKDGRISLWDLYN